MSVPGRYRALARRSPEEYCSASAILAAGWFPRLRRRGAGVPMVKRIPEASPRLTARMAGVFYLLTVLGGVFAQGFVSDRLVVSGDAAATATNILTHKRLFQLGFTVYLTEMACQIAMTVLFYYLLKPAGRIVSLLAASLGITGCIIKTFSRVFYIAPLFVLGGAHYLNVFSLEQLQAVALLFLRVNEQGAG